MKIAVTGATGFVGRYIVRRLLAGGHSLRCWYRTGSNRQGEELESPSIEWQLGDLGDAVAAESLAQGCDAIVHAALYKAGSGFMGAEGEVIEFVQKNVVGTLRLIEAARRANVQRFVFISTCAVHDKILSDRPLDETHPLWAMSHYGAHKGAIEKFVHSYGLGQGFPICALRPTGVYGVATPASDSKWFNLVRNVVQGRDVTCQRGGKEVHAADVAQGVDLLLHAPAEKITGEAFNCFDRYISEWDVAHLAKQMSGSDAAIHGRQTTPKNQIVTEKIRSLGMQFGGRQLLEETIREMVDATRPMIR